MISYAAMLTKDTTPYDLNKNLPPKSSLKRNFTVSYDINATHDFPNIYNTQKKLKQKTNTRTREAMGNTIDTSTPASNQNEDNLSTLLVRTSPNYYPPIINPTNLHFYKCLKTKTKNQNRHNGNTKNNHG